MAVKYRAVAEIFKPEDIKKLIIGECPPSDGKSYFYIPTPVKNLESMPGTIFTHYFQCIPTTENKYFEMLCVLKEYGIFLIDILDHPILIRDSGGIIKENLEILKTGIQNFPSHLARNGIDVPQANWTFLIPTGRNYTRLLKNLYPEAKVIIWPDYRRITEPLIENTKVSKDLLFEFFINFAKFEFALKTSGFAKGNERGASPHWDKYAQSIKEIFDKTKNDNLLEAIDFFLINPPWKQVLINGAMDWDASLPENVLSEIEKVLILIRRVRNNLFHGGKFNFDIPGDKERTINLLSYSIAILKECLQLSPDVKYNFDHAKI